MIIDANWTPPPMIKDLPRQGRISIRCKVCDLCWSEPVSDLIDRRLGAMYVDLLEMQTRCLHPACRRSVVFTCEGNAELVSQPPKTTVRRPAFSKVVRPRPMAQVDLFGAEIVPPGNRLAMNTFETRV